jgi:hypothetical protein
MKRPVRVYAERCCDGLIVGLVVLDDGGFRVVHTTPPAPNVRAAIQVARAFVAASVEYVERVPVRAAA